MRWHHHRLTAMTTVTSPIRAALVATQAAAVAKLEAELAAFVEAGDEYHAEGVRLDLWAARSLARLVHNDEGRVVYCASCGTGVTERVAADRNWGVLHGQPQCSVECAEWLYEAWYARAKFTPASPDLPLSVAPWLRYAA
jgi:hypothetical protein